VIDTAIQVVDSSFSPPVQASSDAEMIGIWLDSFRSLPGRISATQRGYTIDLRAFRAFTDKPMRQIVVRDIQAFAATLGHLAPASQARRLSAVKSLFTMAHELGYVPFDVGRPVPLPAVKDRLAERIMSEAEMQRLLWLETNPRNAAMLRLFYLAGLRLSELCALTWRDFA
jgi:integrase/recombinase XerD